MKATLIMKRNILALQSPVPATGTRVRRVLAVQLDTHLAKSAAEGKMCGGAPGERRGGVPMWPLGDGPSFLRAA